MTLRGIYYGLIMCKDIVCWVCCGGAAFQLGAKLNALSKWLGFVNYIIKMMSVFNNGESINEALVVQRKGDSYT